MDELTHSEACARITLAQSILNHRSPTAHNIDLAIAALEGAHIGDLIALDHPGEAA